MALCWDFILLACLLTEKQWTALLFLAVKYADQLSGLDSVALNTGYDKDLAEIKEKLGGRYIGIEYDDLLTDVKRELLESVQLAHDAGIPDNKIILDPVLGFGKTVEQNLELIHRLDEIRALGYPVLVGPSRKSFIGYTLDLPPDDRLAGTAALVTVGICKGADIVRVHDVGFMVQVSQMTDAVERLTA